MDSGNREVISPVVSFTYRLVRLRGKAAFLSEGEKSFLNAFAVPSHLPSSFIIIQKNSGDTVTLFLLVIVLMHFFALLG